jgi:hypothetical protein
MNHTQFIYDVVHSYTATIYIGLKDFATGVTADPALLQEFVRSYVREFRRGTPAGCVTVTPTTFSFVDGYEDGFAIGFINYPRFPTSPDAIKQSALRFAEALVVEFRQRRVSVVLPDETVMIAPVEV